MAGTWLLVAIVVHAGTIFLRLLSFQPFHRYEYATAAPYLESMVVLDEVGSFLRVPGLRAQLANDWMDVGEARAGLCRSEAALGAYARALELHRARDPSGPSEEPFIRWKREEIRRDAAAWCSLASREGARN